jgi:hypothetical protein
MWCRSSLSGRADALYVVNDALGSFLLRASEVIDQVPMSACANSGSQTDRGPFIHVVQTEENMAILVTDLAAH